MRGNAFATPPSSEGVVARDDEPAAWDDELAALDDEPAAWDDELAALDDEPEPARRRPSSEGAAAGPRTSPTSPKTYTIA